MFFSLTTLNLNKPIQYKEKCLMDIKKIGREDRIGDVSVEFLLDDVGDGGLYIRFPLCIE